LFTRLSFKKENGIWLFPPLKKKKKKKTSCLEVSKTLDVSMIQNPSRHQRSPCHLLHCFPPSIVMALFCSLCPLSGTLDCLVLNLSALFKSTSCKFESIVATVVFFICCDCILMQLLFYCNYMIYDVATTTPILICLL